MMGRLREFLVRKIEVAPGEPLPDESSRAPFDNFLAYAEALGPTATVAEIGTKQWVEGSETHMHEFLPNIARENYVMIDIEDGSDVDVVADLHKLPADWSGRFDALVAGAVFEHLERPWIAAHEVARVLKPGGRCYIATHQTYPLHGFPSDFFRFSKEALSLIFADAGIDVLHVAYEHRAEIVPTLDVMPKDFARLWNRNWPSYLCVNLHGAKPGPSDKGA